MNKDKFQNQYNEVFREIKEEKMEWSFDDFLQKVETKEDGEANIISLEHKKPRLPKWFWMAAGFAFLVGIGAFYFQPKNKEIKEQLVKDEILKQKNDFINENNEASQQMAILDSTSGTKKDSVFQEQALAEKDELQDLLSKRARIKKERKPKYATRFLKNDSTEYQDSYVVVNGKEITSEKEAVDITKYSLMVLREKFKRTIATSQNNENIDNDY